MTERISKYYSNIFLLFFVGVFGFFLFGVVSVTSASCWQYTSGSTCTLSNGCLWRNDSWNSNGWCEELSCGTLSNQSACTTISLPGKNCTWQGGMTNYACEEVSCWSFSGTNNNSCESNWVNKSCSWGGSCYNIGNAASGAGSANCFGITNESTCKNATGCGWGQCYEKGCGSYTINTSCNSARDWKGNNCTWSSSGSYCRENNCWDILLYPNQTACQDVQGISCEWKWSSCQEKDCWSFDFINASACVNNTIGKTCKWDGSYCTKDNCWGVNTNASCSAKTNCQWKSWPASSWCEEVNCWTWDSTKGGNQSLCESNTQGINCIWSGNPAGNRTNGWCYKDVSTTSCSNVTTERECYDTYYCWWKANSWNDPSLGGNCTTPTWGTGEFSGISSDIMNDWSPGCYIFDVNSTKCNSVTGCNFTANNVCDETTDVNGTAINARGISCYQINESELCNNIASLGNCCTWQNGTCSNNQQSRNCFSQLDETPNGEKACEDAKTKSNCDTISNDPWYMPCKWNNSTTKCEFKIIDVFGNTSQSIVKIENQRNCEAAGGKWITENYCEGSVSVPIGRCEYKFDDEDNCDKACFACETKDRDGKRINATNAKDACVGSKLGFCEFTTDTTAPNMIGYCKAKEQWKKGLAGDCSTTCGDCTFLGYSKSNSSRDSANNYLTPSFFYA